MATLDRVSSAEAALAAALRQKLTRKQARLAEACPELLRRLAHASALPPRTNEVAEDVAADAVPRVARHLCAIAEPTRRQAIGQFFDSEESALLPLCNAVAVSLQGAPSELRQVAETIHRLLSELPPDKPRLLWRFGRRTFCSALGDSAESLLARLEMPAKRRQAPRICEPAGSEEIEALAKRWDEYREP